MHKPNQNIESCESVESSICDELSAATNTECVTDLKIKDEQIIILDEQQFDERCPQPNSLPELFSCSKETPVTSCF